MASPDLQQKFIDILTSIQNAAVPAAKAGLHLTLGVIQLTAIIAVVKATLLLIILVILWVSFRAKVWNGFEKSETCEEGWMVLIVGACFTTAGCGLYILITLLDTDTWLSIFAPQLELTNLAIHKLL